MYSDKKNILFVIDKPKWAYHIIAKFVSKELSHKYNFYFDFQIKKSKTIKGQLYNIYNYFLAKKHRSVRKDMKYDIACYLWWKSTELYTNKLTAKKMIVGIFTEGFPPGGAKELNKYNQETFINNYLAKYDAIACGNKNILDSYRLYEKPCFYTTGGVNLNIFNTKPKMNEEFIVAWTGNPNRIFKGFAQYIEPAVNLAKKRRPNIQFKTRFSGSYDTLPQFYSSVDVLINASVADAGPGFIVEGGACGVPTISTPGGFADELILHRENGSLVRRNISAIADEIVYLFDNRDVLNNMKENIQKDIFDDWGVKSRAYYWEVMFENLLNSNG